MLRECNQDCVSTCSNSIQEVPEEKKKKRNKKKKKTVSKEEKREINRKKVAELLGGKDIDFRELSKEERERIKKEIKAKKKKEKTKLAKKRKKMERRLMLEKQKAEAFDNLEKEENTNLTSNDKGGDMMDEKDSTEDENLSVIKGIKNQ